MREQEGESRKEKERSRKRESRRERAILQVETHRYCTVLVKNLEAPD